VITTSRTRPITSTAIWRLRPLTFLALSWPRLARGTVSAARTDWESMTAAVGWGLRPAAVLTRARSSACSRLRRRHHARRRSSSKRSPGREAGGQVPPRAPGPVQAHDRLDDPPRRPDPGPAPPPRPFSGQVRGDHLPLGIGQVAGIPDPPFRRGAYPGHARALVSSWSSQTGIMRLAPCISPARHARPRLKDLSFTAWFLAAFR
jgi:hypothetical protein